MHARTVLFLLVALFAPTAPAATLPPAVSEAISLALASGDREVLDKIIEAAKQRYPAFTTTLDALAAEAVLYTAPTQLSRAAMAAPPPRRMRSREIDFDRAMRPSFWDRWSGELSLSVRLDQDTVNEFDIGARAALVYEFDRWKNSTDIRARFESLDGTQTTQRYRLEDRLDYTLSELTFLFGELEFRYDRFSDVELDIAERLGVGRSLYQSDSITLDALVAVGAEQSRAGVPGASIDNSALASAGLDFEWLISERLSFTQNANADRLFGENSGTNLDAESRLTVQATESIFGRLSYRIERFGGLDDSQIEQEFTLDVGYSF